MELQNLSQKRGIYSFYNGSEYIIYSTYYGVVAHSTKIERDKENKKAIIDFDICQWYGYWDLKSIITKGINKLEKRYCEDKKVVINYNTIENTDNTLENTLYLNVKLENR